MLIIRKGKTGLIKPKTKRRYKMITFTKTNDNDFKTYYQVFSDGEYIDYIGNPYDTEHYGSGWVNGSSEVADIIGGGFDFKSIKQAFIDNEARIKEVA
jgi:hypothetical protein